MEVRDQDCETTVEMIFAGVLAGAYRELAREIPSASRGLLKMAEKHSARVSPLADEICANAGGCYRQASRRMPAPKTR